MQISESLSSTSLAALQALIPSVALGIALTAAVSVVLRRTVSFNAATRYAVWAATLAVLPLIPIWLPASRAKAPASAAPSPVVKMVYRNPPVPIAAAAGTAEAAVPVSNSIPATQRLDIVMSRDLPLLLLGAYAAIVLLLLLRLLVSYLRVRLLRRRSRPAPPEVHARMRHWLARCPAARPVELLLSDTVRSPLAIGFLRPAIVMPASLVLELGQEEFDDVGVHELAHIRRYDDWTNLFQQLVQAFLFFHPAVYWVSRKLKFEREVACDDWVVSTNGPKSYARCLTKIMELRRCHRGFVLASGAFFGKGQISRRVELILNKTRNGGTGVSALTVVAVTVALIGLGMQVARIPSVVALTRDDGSARVNARWKDENRDLRVSMRGDLKLTADERSIAALSPLGYLEIAEWKGWSSRRLEVRAAATGDVEEKYFVDGRQKTFDDSARAWAASIYPFLQRELGIDAEGRVNRILSRRGAAGVLDEVNLIRGDHIKRRYLTLLMQQETLTSDDLHRVAMCVRKLNSDHEKAEFLLANPQRFASDPLRASFFQAADSIHSDYDRRRVLIAMLNADGGSPETASLVGRAAKAMHSDHDKAEVLLAIPAASGADGCAVFKAARSIQSDNDKSRVLRQAGYRESSQCRADLFAVVNSIHSDNDRSAVLRDLLSRPDLEVETYRNIAISSIGMSSDNDKATVLVSLGGAYLGEPFFDAIKTLHSDNDRKRVLKAVIERDAAKPALLHVIDAASGIASDHDKADVLIAAAKASSDPELRASIQRACGKLHSDNDYRRVASLLLN
jgi:beta-lactamase regulating signal transducer with metallopeptidase domain